MFIMRFIMFIYFEFNNINNMKINDQNPIILFHFVIIVPLHFVIVLMLTSIKIVSLEI